MSNYILAAILLLLASAGVIVRKTYYYLPARELKRQAERGDPLAIKFYRAVAYGPSLRSLLWLFIGLTSAGSFIVLVRVAPNGLDLLAVVLILGLVHAWLPAGRVNRVGTRLTVLVTPAIAWLLNYLHPVLSRAAEPVQKRHAKSAHTGLFEREDLVRLLDRQKGQTDSRLTEEELDTAKRALDFGKQTVSDVLTPRKKVKTISADDTVGPILIDELHKLDQPFVLVSGNTKNDIVGALSINRLGIQSTGRVRDHMSTVSYVHEKDSLAAVLHAFYTTNHSLYIVVNDFEEFVGIVTVEAIIEQLLGKVPSDDFDQYTDLQAVAHRHEKAAVDEPAEEPEAPEKTVDETPEPEISDEKTDEEPETSEEPTEETPGTDTENIDPDFESVEVTGD